MNIKVKHVKSNQAFDKHKPTHAEQLAQLKAKRNIDHLSTKRVLWLLIKRHKFLLVCLVAVLFFTLWALSLGYNY